MADLFVLGNQIYIVSGNTNKVVVYKSIPTRPDQLPDYAIGGPDLYTNTLFTNHFVTNPNPVSDGRSLFVTADFDKKLYIWKSLPDQSGARADIVYNFDFQPFDIFRWRETFVLAGEKAVMIWRKPPLAGEPPDLTFRGRIGNERFQFLVTVALDDKYFYLGEADGTIRVWQGIPSADSPPAFTLRADGLVNLHSDGTYLTVAAGQKVLIYSVSTLSADAKPVSLGGDPVSPAFSLPRAAIVSHGHLFVADTNFNRVHIWRRVEDAIVGKAADVILGDKSHKIVPEIGRSSFYWPGALSFDGNYLWWANTSSPLVCYASALRLSRSSYWRSKDRLVAPPTHPRHAGGAENLQVLPSLSPL